MDAASFGLLWKYGANLEAVLVCGGATNVVNLNVVKYFDHLTCNVLWAVGRAQVRLREEQVQAEVYPVPA